MEKANKRIRDELKKHGFYLWQLADIMQISESHMYVKIRRELPEDMQNSIIDLIRQEAEKERKEE